MVDEDSYKQHISEQFNAELEAVKTHMLEMGGLIENQISAAVSVLVAGEAGATGGVDLLTAEQIIARDDEVNAMEVAIDEECSRILARRQPAASDLRMVLAISKAITDMERIGDHAAKIALQSIKLTEKDASPSGYVELRHIGGHVAQMLRDALDAFARMDVAAAVEVAREDIFVDKEYGSAMRSLMTYMMEDPRVIGAVMNEIWALRALERIGDRARNIAEHVIYLVRGTNVRHVELDELIAQLEKPH